MFLVRAHRRQARVIRNLLGRRSPGASIMANNLAMLDRQ
jgi:hypothetical protein